MSSSESTSDPIRTGPEAWLHFVGVGGSGMSALAQFHALAAAGRGGLATGSDRAFDQGERQEIRTCLERSGVVAVLQDGSGPLPRDGRRCDAVVVSTAVEDSIPDVRAAREQGVPVLHRSELLARYVQAHRTIAVSGTSGKSTVTGMVFAVLRGCGLGPGLLTGGPLADLAGPDALGNAWAPEGDADPPWLVIEADESDGSLVRYRPEVGVVLNLGLDHKPQDEVLQMFRTFRARTSGPFLVSGEANLAELREGAALFGLEGDDASGRPGTWAREVELSAWGSRFGVDGVEFTLDQPGRHNVANAAAAIAVGRALGLPLADMAAPLAAFGGIARRFQRVGSAAGVTVVDDFAHNPDKIAASLAAAAAGPAEQGRILAVFQPHGFGPTRFLRPALVEAFASGLRSDDVLWLPEIYYAGGTVTRDISSADLVADILARNRVARFAASRADLIGPILAEARPGDLVLVMGARDPSLTDFCREILAGLVGK